MVETHGLDAVIAGHDFFAGSPQSHIDIVTGCASNVRFRAGEMLCAEGDDADRFFIIRHGQVSIETHSPGRGRLVIQTVGQDEVVGLSWLVPPYRWLFDARAVEEVRAIAFDAVCLRGKCEADAALGFDLLRRCTAMLLRRVHAARVQMLDLYGERG